MKATHTKKQKAMQREIKMMKVLKEHKNTQKKTLKQIRVMEKINEKKNEKN